MHDNQTTPALHYSINVNNGRLVRNDFSIVPLTPAPRPNNKKYNAIQIQTINYVSSARKLILVILLMFMGLGLRTGKQSCQPSWNVIIIITPKMCLPLHENLPNIANRSSPISQTFSAGFWANSPYDGATATI